MKAAVSFSVHRNELNSGRSSTCHQGNNATHIRRLLIYYTRAHNLSVCSAKIMKMSSNEGVKQRTHCLFQDRNQKWNNCSLIYRSKSEESTLCRQRRIQVRFVSRSIEAYQCPHKKDTFCPENRKYGNK